MVHRSDRLALYKDGESWTYRRLLTEADRLAAGFAAAGVRAGDRVALHLANGPEIALAYLACFRLGAIAAPLNLRFKTPELEAMLRRLRPCLYIGDTAHYRLVQPIGDDVLDTDARFVIGKLEDTAARPWASLLRDAATVTFDDPDVNAPAMLFSTSGSTGQPKLVAHSQATFGQASMRSAQAYLEAGDRLAFFMPMVHVAGFNHFFSSLIRGASSIMLDGADPDGILDGIETHRCTYLATFPTIYAHLIDRQRHRPRDVSSLRLCLVAGDVCPPGRQEMFQSLFGRPLNNFWGATEASGTFTYGLVPGPVSRPIPGVEIRLVDAQRNPVATGEAGELLLRGPNLSLGYWIGPGDCEGFADGWYATGDIMREDEAGNFWYVARAKDLIVRAGSNISPAEVEHVLVAHPAVIDAAVVGVPDPILGQCVIGLLQLEKAHAPDQLYHIRRSVSLQLADYKVPERLLAVPAIPRNALGKINRAALAEMAQSR
ncbi:MAG: class I adenylate-forming enzyme family protein [Dongiaceae bacterium]